MDDLDTIQYLEQFKKDYLSRMLAIHEVNKSKFATMTNEEALKAQDIEDKVHFLSNFVACIEATLEQNAVLKIKLKDNEKTN